MPTDATTNIQLDQLARRMYHILETFLCVTHYHKRCTLK